MALSHRHQQTDAPSGDEPPCPHQRGHVLDSLFHGQGYATAASRRIFCDHCRLRRWLRVEVALAAGQVVLLARLARANAALCLESMVQEHERDSRGLRMEWVAVADVSHYTLAALEILNTVLAGLHVHRDRMARNAAESAESLCTEALMLALTDSLGRQSAHTLIYDVSQRAQSAARPFRAALLERDEITRVIGPDRLDALLDPARYTGESAELTDRTVARARHWLTARPVPHRPEEALL